MCIKCPYCGTEVVEKEGYTKIEGAVYHNDCADVVEFFSNEMIINKQQFQTQGAQLSG